MSTPTSNACTTDKHDFSGLDIPQRPSHADYPSNNDQDPLRDELDNISRAVTPAKVGSPQQNGVQEKKHVMVPRPDLAKEPWHGAAKVLEQADLAQKRVASNESVGDVTSQCSRSR
ncbi:uncharacterized protein PV06_01875 [Exophiala oligosperma]|uniref:Uncharacterized protein n=1 Tax=Exophiala oligosperma TaxID=215243 RepID=A0A0D2DUH8_9EURO|nr:uncharacterized protein PV06_01875 [Exophiala oligosperma]KIW46190.1 hypothetical protein PV06_01875 [Exophiala oligosperma]